MMLARSLLVLIFAGAPVFGQTLSPMPCSEESSLRSTDGSTPTSITFQNSTLETVQMYWLDYNGMRQAYGSLAPGTSYTQGTFLTHPWVAADTTGACLEIFLPVSSPATAIITGGGPAGAVSGGALPNATVGAPYLVTLAAAGGAPPYYNWRVVSGTLPSGLSLNPATGSIGGTPNSAAGSPFTFNVTATDSVGVSLTAHQFSIAVATPSAPAQLGAAPGVLEIDAVANSSTLLERSLQLSNSGGGSVSFTAAIAAGSPWITGVTPSSGSVTAGSPVSVIVTINSQGLSAGNNRAVIHFTPSTGTAFDVPVTVFASNGVPVLGIGTTGVLFNMSQGAGTHETATVKVLNQGDPSSTVHWSAKQLTVTGLGGPQFLTLSPAFGTATPANPADLVLGVDSSAASLAPGAYYSLLQISDAGSQNSEQLLTAILNIAPASTPVAPAPSPAGLLFVGSTTGGALPPQQIEVDLSSSIPVAFQATASTSDGSNWLQISSSGGAASGSTPGSITVFINRTGLAAGVYTGEVEIIANSLTRGVNVTLVLTGSGTASAMGRFVTPDVAGCVATRLILTETGLADNFSIPAGWPANIATALYDDCGNPVNGGSVVASFSNGDAPLSLTDFGIGGQYGATWQPSSLANLSVSLTGTAGSLTPASARLSGRIAPNQAPILTPNGIVNNSNPLLGGALAPGTVAAVYGSGLTASATPASPGITPLPTQFQNTQLLVGSFGSPLYFLSGNQLDAQIPAELNTPQKYPAVAVVNGALTLPITITIAPVSPGVAAYADGSAIAQHNDFTLVTQSSPAHPGESLMIYLSGMGATNPPVASGQVAPGAKVGDTLASAVIQPEVEVDGQTAQIEFAGLTPGGVGLYQINFVVPNNVSAGSVQLTVTQQGIAANATTLPVAVP